MIGFSWNVISNHHKECVLFLYIDVWSHQSSSGCSNMLLFQEINNTEILFYYICLNWATVKSKSSREHINQKVSILLAMAARANKMIIHINNRPNVGASQRTYKGGRQKARHWIRWQFKVNESHLQLRFIGQWQWFSGIRVSENIKLQLVFVPDFISVFSCVIYL